MNTIDDVLLKIEDMHKSLRMSDEIFPLISDLFLFIKEIIPLMLEVNSFMKDSSKKIPSASENISNVSKVTEMAAHEVLDRLDIIAEQLSKLKERIKSEGASEDSMAMVDTIANESNEITFAFQFQDITTQQLEYVNRILKAIYEKFTILFQSSLQLKDKSILGNDVVAAIENELNGQNNKASEEFNKKTEDTMHRQGISQDDIDKYFIKHR